MRKPSNQRVVVPKTVTGFRRCIHALLLFLIAQGCAGIVPEKERRAVINERIGYFAESHFLNSLQIFENDEVEAGLRDLVDELCAHADPAVTIEKIYIANTPIVNAFACSNGTIFVTTGLLDLLETRGELAAIMGHEITHVKCRDVIEGYVSGERGRVIAGYPKAVIGEVGEGLYYISYVCRILPPLAPVAAPLNGLMSYYPSLQFTMDCALDHFVHKAMYEGYSQDAELRADRQGALLAMKAGYSADDAVTAMERLLAIEQEYVESRQSSSLVNSEPGITERISELRDSLPGIQSRR